MLVPRALQVLNAERCDFCEEGLMRMIDALKANSTLRELRAAIELKKTIVVVRETERVRGGMSDEEVQRLEAVGVDWDPLGRRANGRA